jgi:hypothetical protein
MAILLASSVTVARSKHSRPIVREEVLLCHHTGGGKMPIQPQRFAVSFGKRPSAYRADFGFIVSKFQPPIPPPPPISIVECITDTSFDYHHTT